MGFRRSALAPRATSKPLVLGSDVENLDRCVSAFIRYGVDFVYKGPLLRYQGSLVPTFSH